MLSFYRQQTRWFSGSKIRSGDCRRCRISERLVIICAGRWMTARDNVICRKLGADVGESLSVIP